MPINLPDLLKATLDMGGSDLHLSMGRRPRCAWTATFAGWRCRN